MRTLLTVIATVVWSSTTILAQDIHFSQVGNSPLNLNPALTGIFEGDVRLMGNYRKQWRTSTVNYETYSFAGDMSFYNKNYEQRFFSAGIVLNHDVKGDARLEWTNASLSGSYTHRVGAGHYLTAGLTGSISQRRFDMSGLQFDVQYNEEIFQFDPDLSNNESFSNRPNKLLFDASVGLNWHYRVPDPDKRTSFDVGLGIMHFNKPIWSFQDEDEQQLRIRWNPYIFTTIQLRPDFDLQANIVYKQQLPHRAYLASLGGQYHFDTDYDQERSIHFGFNFRFNDRIDDTSVLSRDVVDAFIPYVGLRYRMIRATFSYDFNMSDYNIATDYLAGPEFSVIYIFSKVKPMVTKICPIYL